MDKAKITDQMRDKVAVIQSFQKAATFKPRIEPIKRSDDWRRRAMVGLGSFDAERIGTGQDAALSEFVAAMKASVACPLFNMPVVEQTRWTIGGPMLDDDVTRVFGDDIDIFGRGRDPATSIDYVATTMAQNGELQTTEIVCAIFFHIEPEPLCWTQTGNAWTRPTVGATQPPSPDVFTQNDRANGALGPAIAAGTQVMLPAAMEWGWWANMAAWHMVRGFDIRWKIGQHTNILDENLRHTAYMPPNAQEGSASNSEVDTFQFIRRANNRYDGFGSGLSFLKHTHIREGSVGAAGVNNGRFRPSRAFDLVPATYGGMDLRSLLSGNSEFRKLNLPYVLDRGVPIGLICQESDPVQANLMREYLSITQSYDNGIPPIIVDQAFVNPDPTLTGAAVALERTIDGADVSQGIDAERVVFKGGDLKVTMGLKGFQVDGDWAGWLNANPGAKRAFECDCGCAWGK